MSGLGEFSTHTRHGDLVTKQLSHRHPAGARFVAAASAGGAAGLRGYLDTLRAVGVRLPGQISIVGDQQLTIRHRWVQGPTLLESAATDPVRFAHAVDRVTTWVRALEGTDARIDTNLANFCVSAGEPVLIDVLPPLRPSQRPEPQNLFDTLFAALCFDTPVILDALVGYALRALLSGPGSAGAAALLLPVAHRVITPGRDTGFPAGWFRTRARLAIGAARGEEHLNTVRDFFALTSVLAFRQLDEVGRRRRLGQVTRRIRELNR